MLEIIGNDKQLYQWDADRTARVAVECDEVHFSNLKYGEAYPIKVIDGVVKIPDEVLMTGAIVYCWAFVKAEDGGHTRQDCSFAVEKRPKPSDYVYTPAEIMNVEKAVNNALEKAKESGDFKGDKGDKGDRGEQGEVGKDGADGKDGETPYIGSNGNWWIGDTDLGVSASTGVFIATYGQTTYSDMRNAWKAGKLVVLKGDVESALTIRMLVHVSTDKIFFGRVLAESQLVEEVIVTSGNKWSLIKNNYATKAELPNLSDYATKADLDRLNDLSDYATKSWVALEGMEYAPQTLIKVFQTTKAGIIKCETNKTYMVYCTGDTEATVRGYGDQNTDSNGNQHEVSGKYLTVYCGGQYDTFDDGNGNTLSNNGAALWYATAMTQGTISPIGSMNVRRGVVKHPDGDQWAEISYPSGCSIVITETLNLPKTPSKGLEFKSNGDGTCEVKGLGDCTDTDIVIPSVSDVGDRVKGIANAAFANPNNSKFTSIVIPNSIISIGSFAIYNNSTVERITIGNGTTVIGDYAFAYSPKITNVKIGNGVISIGKYAFNRCTSLINATIPDSVTSIGTSAFESCTSLRNVIIGDGVTSVGNMAFMYCENLESVTIGNGVTSIDAYAFDSCSKLATIYYTGTEEQWNSIAKGEGWDLNTGAYTVIFNYKPKN